MIPKSAKVQKGITSNQPNNARNHGAEIKNRDENKWIEAK